MTIAVYGMATLSEFVGRELGVSEWTTIGQERIDAFAECTGDRQWIHVDENRARSESPYGGTIAHGYLTLSLVASSAVEIGVVPTDASAGLNYGVDKVRFLAPVRSGKRVRNRIALLGVEDKGAGRVLIRMQNTLQIEGEEKPALIAETLAMLIK